MISKTLCRRLSACFAPAVVVSGSLALLGETCVVAQERVQRSTADVRDRPPDELDRPRNKERLTHRGYEIKTDKFVVVANTRVEDARWVAQQIEATWADFSRLADVWMKSHHQPDFGIGAVQVYIDGNVPKARDLPTTTLSVIGIQTQITIHVAPGQPELPDQLYQLRKAAGQAFLHTSELDRQLPPWVCDGLASYVAAERMSPEEVKAGEAAFSAPGAPQLGGRQWRFQRVQQDQLHNPKFDQSAAAQEVEFLLTANDAAHAPSFFAAIDESMAAVNKRRIQGNLVTARPGEEQPAEFGPCDQLAIKLARNFEQWQKSPLSGQPKLDVDEKAPPEVQQTQAEMAVVLKLARRFSTPRDTSAVRTRITAFDKEKGMSILSRKEELRPVPLPELYQKMTSHQQPLWGTLNVQGKLVLSSDGGALRELLGLEDNRFQWETENGRAILSTHVSDQWKIAGWLEENKEDPSRPLAKFTATKIAAQR